MLRIRDHILRVIGGFPPSIKVLSLPLFLLCLWVSLAPLLSRLTGGVRSSDPFRSLSYALKMDPWNHEWAYYLAEAWRAVGRDEKSEEFYVRAVKTNPLDPMVWSSWADLCLDMGRKEDAIYALKRAAYLDPSSSFIQWRILVRLLSIATPESQDIARDQISRLLLLVKPSKRENLFALGYTVAGDEEELEELLPDDPQIWKDYIRWLLPRGEDLRVVRVWEELRDKGWTDRKLFRFVVEGLICRRHEDKAWRIWKEEYPADGLIHNGGFERDLAGFGFGWRWSKKIPGLKSWGFDREDAIEGNRAFFMEFDGEHNPQVNYPRQLVYIDGPGTYRLTAYMKTEEVTGAKGFSLQVWGKGLRVHGKELRGYNPWKLVSLILDVKGQGPFWVGLVRGTTRKLNKFLGGRVWIDQVVLEKMNEEESAERASG